jgi:hypothetical protein
MYPKTKWKDEVKDASTGEILQEGTLQSAGNFNNMEEGILDTGIALSMMLNMLGNIVAGSAVESHTVTLTNSQSYPFNNSVKTIALDNTRSTNNYIVDATVISADGQSGDITIYDKLLNGFKVKFEGSATSVTLKLNITGGM